MTLSGKAWCSVLGARCSVISSDARSYRLMLGATACGSVKSTFAKVHPVLRLSFSCLWKYPEYGTAKSWKEEEVLEREVNRSTPRPVAPRSTTLGMSKAVWTHRYSRAYDFQQIVLSFHQLFIVRYVKRSEWQSICSGLHVERPLLQHQHLQNPWGKPG